MRKGFLLLLLVACTNSDLPTAEEMVELRKIFATELQANWAMGTEDMPGDKTFRASAMGDGFKVLRIDWDGCSQQAVDIQSQSVEMRLLKFNRLECNSGKTVFAKPLP